MSYMKDTVTPATAFPSPSVTLSDYDEFVKSILHTAGVSTGGSITMPGTTGAGSTGTTWIGGPTVSTGGTPPYFPSIKAVRTPAVLTAKSRMNKDTMARLGPSFAFDKVRKKLVTQLLEQLITSKAVTVTSIVNDKTGAVTFQATVTLHDPS
jgi:hypothetical protein